MLIPNSEIPDFPFKLSFQTLFKNYWLMLPQSHFASKHYHYFEKVELILHASAFLR